MTADENVTKWLKNFRDDPGVSEKLLKDFKNLTEQQRAAVLYRLTLAGGSAQVAAVAAVVIAAMALILTVAITVLDISISTPEAIEPATNNGNSITFDNLIWAVGVAGLIGVVVGRLYDWRMHGRHKREAAAHIYSLFAIDQPSPTITVELPTPEFTVELRRPWLMSNEYTGTVTSRRPREGE